MGAAALGAAGALLVLGAGGAAASPCTDRIGPLEARLNDAAGTAAAASSGGQGVAAAREGQAVEARNQNQPAGSPPAVPFQSEGREAQATQRASQAATAGDGAMQARAALNRAKTLDGQNDAAGCMAAAEDARRLLDGGR